MNISALKSFAPAVRKQLIEAVTRKLDQALTARTPDYLDTYATQVRALREHAAEDRKGLIERVAYTWFNRFAALRYLDAKNWHPFHVRVLTAAGPDETLPELLKVMRAGALPDELLRYTDVARLESLLIGRIPSADPQAEVYRHLVLAACRFYHGLLPDVFERLDDETELLLPDDLLTAQSVAEGCRTEITDDDCEQVEVLGWLYQFYISEKKDEVMKRKAAVPAEDIPAVTQLFTPHWIVRYLVENSLGRLWMLNRPGSLLGAWMPYYIESAEPETEFLRIEHPQDIRLCDPAVGSGHMLTYAFDLLYVIYEEEGYAPSEIPALILRHNLTGIEIDARAAQLAALALTLKGREKSPRFFQQQHFVRPNIVELRDIRFAEGELLGYSEALGLGGLFTPPILRLMHQFEEAKNFGSLIQPCVDQVDLAFARGIVEAKDLGSNLFLHETHLKVLRALEQAEALAQRYHVAVANPPYMSSGTMNGPLKTLAKKSYPISKSDTFSMFIQRAIALCSRQGLAALVTMQGWMFLSSFEELRYALMQSSDLISLVHIGPRGFDSISGEIVQTAAFVIKNDKPSGRTAHYVRVVEGRSELHKRLLLEEAAKGTNQAIVFDTPFARMKKIPGTPLAYWASPASVEAFQYGSVDDAYTAKKGMAIGDNAIFLRRWTEVSFAQICRTSHGPADTLKHRWYPCLHGGEQRKWYGNQTHIVNWINNGEEPKRNITQKTDDHWSRYIISTDFFFRRGVTWTAISSGQFAARYYPEGFAFTSASMCAFPGTGTLTALILLLNSCVARSYLAMLSPTLNFGIAEVKKLPTKPIVDEALAEVVSQELIGLARADWNNSETSYEFSDFPLLRAVLKSETLEASWLKWQNYTDAATKKMVELETENNRLMIGSYGLGDELSPEVREDQVALVRADARRDVASLLSYVVGCVMGRYSLDNPGLTLASAGDGFADYLAKVGRAEDDLTFAPDRDGIAPVLDDEWFADDIVARTREFLKVTFGEVTLRGNIRFIEESLGRDLRAYFLTDFYRDHVQTYKKRPIYWMVQSPRKGFSVLIYLHRYTRDTMNVILNRYLREFQVKLRSKIDHLQQMGPSASASNRDKVIAAKELTKLTKTLHECEEWERQTILPLAQARIELDLDDGVKVNYLKLGEALAPIPGLAAAEE